MDRDNDFGEELRHARERAGLTQAELAKAAGWSVSLIAQVERGEKPPSLDFAKRVDAVLGSGGLLERIRARRLRHTVEPDWFRAFREVEQQAESIRWFEPLLVPGLLQTEAYARVLLGDDDRVAARLARQEVLDRANVRIIIDERVLHRKIGDAATMAEQLSYLATEERATVYVLPQDADPRPATLGSFALATVDGSVVAYADTPLRGFVVADPGVASDLRQLWEALTSEALPRSLARETIMEMAERWKTSD